MFSPLQTALCTTLFLCLAICAQACDPGWFGKSCQYKCHCANNNCDNNGDCTGVSGCVPGWFGPQCQYVDLSYTENDIVYRDGNDTTCIDDQSQTTATINFSRTIPFTWLRLYVKNEGLLENITVWFADVDDNNIWCQNRRDAVVDSRTIDIHCDVSVEVKFVRVISADAVPVLCSFYVSGGRNVALKQDARQTSTYLTYGAPLAVDGDTRQVRGSSGSEGCSSTNQTTNPNPSWSVTFAIASDVNRYVIYNRGDCCPERLKEFFLRTFDQDDIIKFTHKDSGTPVLPVYHVTTVTDTSPVRRVSIEATAGIGQLLPLLTLCEVEVYGETVCLVGKYGRECEHTCNCADTTEKCFVSTGGCPSGCAAGYTGENCNQTCPATFYGEGCGQKCSTNCQSQLCDRRDGKCESCVLGKRGAYCEGDCTPKTYGPGCIYSCNMTCLDQLCNATDGRCFDCPAGKMGDQCTQGCPSGFYGNGCTEECSGNCRDVETCDPDNGGCDQGCLDGYIGDRCDEKCNAGKYGENCTFSCSEYCNSADLAGKATCDHVNGTCLYGCESGREGLLCTNTAQQPSESADTVPIGAIVGAIVALLVIVALIVIGVLFWRRRQGKKNNEESSNLGENTNAEGSDTYDNAGFVESGINRSGNPYENRTTAAGSNQLKVTAANAEPGTSKKAKPETAANPKNVDASATYYNTANTGKPQSTAIPIGQLQAFVAANSKEFFKKEFESIPDNKSATTKVAQSAENKQKNRYKNICAYDHSRVCLHKDEEKGLSDYINASYIEGYKGEEKFIASQGPTKIIMNDFIRMLWEQKVEKVVMLTSLVEEGKMKCEKYWPDDEKQWFGDIKMVLTTTEVFADYTIRRLHLTKKGEAVQQLTHFHFTSWPDKGAPTVPWGLVDFEQRVASYPTSKPIVVHCSAGVGRTGTFIALRNVMREAEDTGYVDCFATVQKLRKERINMVQNAEQYEFLHRAAQVAMVCLGTTVTSADIQNRITKLESKTKSGYTFMEQEFKAICSVCADDRDCNVKQDTVVNSGKAVYENSCDVANKLKDRLKNVPSKEQYRAILSCENDDMGDYINAVLVPSFRKVDHQILTQLPLPKTVTDFWRLVTQYKVALVVAFEKDCNDNDSSIAEYLPPNEGETMSVPLFHIKSGSISRGDVSEVQKVTVEAVDMNMKRKEMPVFLKGQHCLTHVKYMNTDLNPKKLLALIRDLRQHSPGPEGKVIFMCRNGATYSGLMCVLTLLLDRMDHDLRLTVPLVVGAIKSIRPQVIPTLDQYKLLYQVLHMYNESNNVYSNFGEAKTPEMSHKKLEGEEEEHKGVYANN